MSRKAKELLILASILSSDYTAEIDFEYAFDDEINDCLMEMYFFMLTGDEERFKAFDEIYQKLEPKKQEYVKNDYLKIIAAQEKQKVKERTDKYE